MVRPSLELRVTKYLYIFELGTELTNFIFLTVTVNRFLISGEHSKSRSSVHNKRNIAVNRYR